MACPRCTEGHTCSGYSERAEGDMTVSGRENGRNPETFSQQQILGIYMYMYVTLSKY